MRTYSKHPCGGANGSRAVPLILNHAPSWLVVTLCLLLLAFAVCMSRHDIPSVSKTTSITVSSGDTLWSIAHAHPVPGLDTAQTVEVIRELNRLKSSSISSGDVIYVPAEERSRSDVAMR